MQDLSKQFEVTLVRHKGRQLQAKSALGKLVIEHPQKRVFVRNINPEPGTQAAAIEQIGYLPDRPGASIIWDPYKLEQIGGAPGLCEFIEAEAQRLKALGEFVEPDPAGYGG